MQNNAFSRTGGLQGTGGKTEITSCSEYFIQKKDWILTTEGNFGSICCPKRGCNQKIGVYSSLGLKCNCGKKVTPGFLIYKTKCI